MQQAINLIGSNITYITLGSLGFTSIMAILVIILLIKHAKLKKAYNNFMRGNEISIEELLQECISKTEGVQKENEKLKDNIQMNHKEIEDNIVRIDKRLMTCIQKMGVVRYNAIEGVGADLSFTVSLLDEENNGVVINGIYTRDGSYTYAKPIIKGASKYTLSDEEIEAINRANS